MEVLSRDEIMALRADLIARSGLSYEELLVRAATYALTPEQSALVDEIGDLDYLLAV